MLNQRISSLEALRFLAALCVVLYHIPTIGLGAFGVDVFFIISGYVMMLSTAKGSELFLLKRAIRIIPVYWIATLGVFFMTVFFSQLFA